MSKSLVIVESPSKAKTIKKYLGNDFSVEASSGHLIDLPSSELGVDLEDNFKPNYVVIKGKKKFLNSLEKAAKKADKVFLASDPDREGEAIAWHIVNKLNLHDKSYRILFNEITKNAIKKSFEHPTKLSKEKFEAQQARRILDRIVGYQVSPILWKKVRRGLSAGRVQSVALRMVVQREREIEGFDSVEYWTVDSKLKRIHDSDDSYFNAQLVRYNGEKIEINNENDEKKIVDSLNRDYRVVNVERKERKKNSAPPFITSTLQQEASRKLRFSVKKTMAVAQKLYEGIELGDQGPVGLITYMRTDSVRVSDEAISNARDYINSNFGNSYLPNKPNVFKLKKNAQDAHEAIRPTYVDQIPDGLQKYLSSDEIKLYKLIWQRFLASQMTHIVYDQTSVDIEAGIGTFRASGSIIKFTGFSAVYMEGKEEEDTDENKDSQRKLPELNQGDLLKLLELEGIQHFTQPPLRFSESSLVKELEDKGIGRPSTYAAIISTIQDRDYVNKKKNKLRATLLGRSVNDLLIDGFPEIMDVQFTADMEEKLDKVEDGGINWVQLLNDFYNGFSIRLNEAEDKMKSLRRDGLETKLNCEICGAPMIIKWGKIGEFLSCSKYPECKNSKQFEYDLDGEIKIIEKKEPEIKHDIICENCGKPMAIRRSKYGEFLGCTGYPQCKTIKRIEKKEVKNENEEVDEKQKVQQKRKVYKGVAS